jgi:hypothetical protein
VADRVSEVADELYSLPPAQFTSAREQRAREARAGGDRQAADAIKKLARPTVGAWLVNQLVRAAPEPMARLFELAESLQQAQQELAGDRLRELSAVRRQVIAELVSQASQIARGAGQPVGASAADEVRGTLEAALADPQARAKVRAGRLAKALAYAGLGEVDMSAQPAQRPQPAQPAQPAQRPQPAEPAEPAEPAQPAASERALLAAEGAVADATAGLATAEARLAGIDEQRQFLQRRVAHLRNELTRAEAEEEALTADFRQAKRDVDAAARSVAAAERRLALARERAGHRGSG